MAENQCLAAFLARYAIEIAAPQPRTQRAIGGALRHLFGHDRIGVAIFDPVRDAEAGQEIRQDVLGKVRLALIEIAGQKIDRQQAAPFEVVQQRQQRVGILTAGDTNKPAGAGPRHAALRDRFTHFTQQALAQLPETDRRRNVAKQRMGALGLAFRFADFVGQMSGVAAIFQHHRPFPVSPPSKRRRHKTKGRPEGRPSHS